MATILIADDQELNRNLISRMISIHGFNSLFAVNGKEAVEKTIHLKPDLILMDMGMPIVAGWEATKLIRQNTETQHIPIVALTAHVLSEDKTQAIEAGCNDYLSKPIDFGKLIATINNLLKPRT